MMKTGGDELQSNQFFLLMQQLITITLNNILVLTIEVQDSNIYSKHS